MSVVVRIPLPGGGVHDHRLGGRFAYARSAAPARSRVAYAAVHVAADDAGRIDYDASLAFRRHIWNYGLGVADAMDTAQRGMGLDWQHARTLIRHSVAEAGACGGRLVCGAQTDQLAPGSARSLRDVEAAYEEQCEYVEGLGGRVVLMASRELARIARSPDDYRRVYGTVLSGLARPALIHWLGEVFDPLLAGYWGSADLDAAAAVVLDLIAEHTDRVEGLKLSLLDQAREIALRRRLPSGVRMFTGDDFDYPTTIAGDGEHASDALLGAFDALAPAAAAALAALDSGSTDRFKGILEPTLPLARHLFSPPTQYYKTGIVFLAYLNGFQGAFRMLGGLETARSAEHLGQVLVLADGAGLLEDSDLAAARARHHFAAAGLDQP